MVSWHYDIISYSFHIGKQTGVNNQWAAAGTQILFVDTLTQIEGWRNVQVLTGTFSRSNI
jgi:hypothetical protein